MRTKLFTILFTFIVAVSVSYADVADTPGEQYLDSTGQVWGIRESVAPYFNIRVNAHENLYFTGSYIHGFGIPNKMYFVQDSFNSMYWQDYDEADFYAVFHLFSGRKRFIDFGVGYVYYNYREFFKDETLYGTVENSGTWGESNQVFYGPSFFVQGMYQVNRKLSFGGRFNMMFLKHKLETKSYETYNKSRHGNEFRVKVFAEYRFNKFVEVNTGVKYKREHYGQLD